MLHDGCANPLVYLHGTHLHPMSRSSSRPDQLRLVPGLRRCAGCPSAPALIQRGRPRSGGPSWNRSSPPPRNGRDNYAYVSVLGIAFKLWCQALPIQPKHGKSWGGLGTPRLSPVFVPGFPVFWNPPHLVKPTCTMGLLRWGFRIPDSGEITTE